MARTPIERISSNDLTVLATDRGPAPMHIAAVLEFEAGAAPTFAEIAAVLKERVPAVPRLRRRLLPAPPGCGRPVWVDDPGFSLDRHLSETEVTDGRDAILQAAAHLACRRLPKDRPPWGAHWVHGGPGQPAALLFVAHHVMADGLGGLAVLVALGDKTSGSAPTDSGYFPQPPPTATALFADAWAERFASLARTPRALAQAAAGLRELGLIGRRRTRTRAPRTSFNRPTGARRRITAVAVPLEGVLAAAHARGCTLNDVVLVAVSGALGSALRARGEEPGPFVVSVPISPRQGAEAARLGNANGVVPVVVPSDPDPAVRLARVMEQSQARKAAPRGTSAGPLGAAFRALARAGLFQRFIDHQRLVTTFLSNMRGPAEPLSLAGRRITRIVPASLTPGNVGVCFTVLSYAGELVLAVLADPDVVPEQDGLTDLLAGELSRLTG